MEKESLGREKTLTDMQKRELIKRFQASEHNPERWWLQQEVLHGFFLFVGLQNSDTDLYTLHN